MPFLERRRGKPILTVTPRLTRHQGRQNARCLVCPTQCPPASVELQDTRDVPGLLPPPDAHQAKAIVCFSSAHWPCMATSDLACSPRRSSCWGAAPSSKATSDQICRAGSGSKARAVMPIATALPQSCFAMTGSIFFSTCDREGF